MNPNQKRFFGIIPAAGHSRRMGRPKLLLDWDGRPLIDHVLDAWTSSQANFVCIVMRKEDQALREVCQRWPVDIVLPDADPDDMKESVQIALQRIVEKHQPSDEDYWMVAPADIPHLSAPLINRLIDSAATQSQIVLPRFGKRPGHPVLFPWCLAAEVSSLVKGGINKIVDKHQSIYVEFPEKDAINDVDTPDDYQHLIQEK